MNEKIKVLEIEIDDCPAKQAMKETMSYMKSEPISVIEMATMNTLMYAKEEPLLKECMEHMDLVLPGEQELLEAAEVIDKRRLQEVEQQTYYKMFLRYLHKNHKRMFLLVETEEEVQEYYDYFAGAYSGIQIVGIARVSQDNCADDMVVNAINGGEADCVIAALSVPLQEQFIARNKSLLNTRVWMGAGKFIRPARQKKMNKNRVSQFITRCIFRRETRKNRREIQMQR